ncbi:hypothetical protein AKJ44_02215 [candidate division MSBL1 archaeon SCGC-AAA261F17]|uniref:Uncharacterized protein n=1 Tax=candidate division MSBL1 archaeon SCGC-AAA261F17 TaxID=1698274 RepID=A0A133V5K2_9EURY|nr:hypothetical protein AKJ44_02215 [candidate division MSBL1 archaeon SCGC-AAA261F17]
MFELDLDSEWVTLKTKRGEENIHIPIKIPNKSYYERLDEDKITSIRLCKRDDQFTFHLMQKIGGRGSPAQNNQDSGVYALTIDLGERHLATEASVKITPNGETSGKPVQRVGFHDDSHGKRQAYREHHIRRKMQNQGKSSTILRHNWRAKNVRRERVQQITNRIAKRVEQAQVEGLETLAFVGNLHTPIPKNRGSLSRRLNSFPRAELRDTLIYKLAKLGVRVEMIPWHGV